MLNMNSEQLAQYMDQTDSLHKPWLLVQLRVKKLEEERATLTPDAYMARLADIHQDLISLGNWWVGREKELF